ncbi:MAG: bacterial transcriptional activator domain-containing protein [Bacteroidales bacterium]|nr:bacterial transcriptional activator domain-containing protein [Bacteroidales bacterium]
MKQTILFFLAVTFGTIAMGQSFPDQFDAAFNRDDYPAMRSVLSQWQEAAPEDADMLVAFYNYYVNYVGQMAASASNSDQIATMQTLADSGLMLISHAISIYPQRLDLRFGKIYFLGVMQRWDDFVSSIILTLDHSNNIHHNWTFPNMDGSMEEIITESVMDYQSTMWETINDINNLGAQDSTMLLRIRKVAKRCAQLFPSDIMSVTTLATTHSALGEYDKAVRYLERAEKMDPTDETVLRNLAHAYAHIGNKQKAKLYQERIKSISQ